MQDFEAAAHRLFSKVFGAEADLSDINRLSGGASQETWALSGGHFEAILRRAPGGVRPTRPSAAIGLATEAALIRIAGKESLPVAKILHVLTPKDELGEGFVMSRVHGETIARPILRDETFAAARLKLPGECGAALAGIHKIATNTLPDLPSSNGSDQIAQYEDIYRGFDIPHPVFELALTWLKANQPAPIDPVLVHGDFRLGNLIVDEQGLAAILDWELAHLGDPREDLAWICVNSWRFGVTENRVGGFGQLEPMLQAYADAGGAVFSTQEIDWWEMLGTLKWGVMCMIMYEAFRSGADPSVERAAIGRRVSETEIDLINLLEAANA